MPTISFINMKGGVAKTTLAINVADVLNRQHHYSVMVVDVDPQFNATQCMLNPSEYMNYIERGGDCITNIFDSKAQIVASVVGGAKKTKNKEIEELIPYTIRENLYLMPGNLNLFRIEMASGEGKEFLLKRFIDACVEKYRLDYVIVDTPPTPSVWMASALIASDYYIVPVKPDPISMTGIELLRSVVDEKQKNFNLRIKCAGVVFTMTDATTTTTGDATRYLRKTPLAKYQYSSDLPKRVNIAKYQSKQKYVLDLDDNSTKIKMTKIVDEMIERISGVENG